MHWATEMAQKIIKERPTKDLYTCASGISPSGRIHIGNFREVITTFFVAKELKRFGKNVRFIFSWDDFDRFRKVPAGISTEFKKYIGLPLSKVPSPDKEHLSYADLFERTFEKELKKMDIETEYIYQSEKYQSGVYNKQVLLALTKRQQIFDILENFKTQQYTQEDKEKYFPISIYCSKCDHDSTNVIEFNSSKKLLKYTCTCGNLEELNILSASNIKLHWKIDWPMRWNFEDVDFEPGGRDHASETGSYTVSKEISKEIFKFEPPMFLGYDFVTIKGSSTKIASSSGNTITLEDVLNVYDRHQIKWLFAKYKASAEFSIALDSDVIRYYNEFDRFVKAYFDKKLEGQLTADHVRFSDVSSDYKKSPSFSHLVSFMPMVNYDEQLLHSLFKKEGVDTATEVFKARKDRALFWIKNYGKDFELNILNDFNHKYYKTLDSDSQKHISITANEIEKTDFSSTEQLQRLLYSIPINDTDSPQDKKRKQKVFFKNLYNMLTGENKGPKLGLFLLALDKKIVLKLLANK